MKTNENLSPKNPSTDSEKVVKMNVLPNKSLRPQKSMMRIKSLKPQKATGMNRIKIKRT